MGPSIDTSYSSLIESLYLDTDKKLEEESAGAWFCLHLRSSDYGYNVQAHVQKVYKYTSFPFFVRDGISL